MFNKRNRWLTTVVMGVAVLAFAGISLIMPLSGLFQNAQKAGSSPTPTASGSPQGDLEAQARGYELVLQREPNNQTALRGLVDVRIQQGNIQKLLDPLEKLAKLNPDQPDYTVLLAQAKLQNGDREGAAQSYRSVLATRPGDIKALKGLSDLLIQQQRPEAAIGLLQDTLNKAPDANKAQPGSIDTTSVQLLLGEVYAVQGRFDEALAIYDQAIASNSQDFRPLVGKALVLRSQGKEAEAKPLFASAVSLAPAQYKDQINQLASAKPSPSPSAGAAPASGTASPPADSGAAPASPDASAAPSPDAAASPSPDASATSSPDATASPSPDAAASPSPSASAPASPPAGE